MNWPSVQCLTIDGIDLSHVDQVEALCAVGVEWIQLRMKSASDEEVLKVALSCLPICRKYGVRLVINDRIQVALEAGADGVHLGRLDMGWESARAFAGSRLLIGGTVNSVEDAKRAVSSKALDYVGVGPFRFTRTKKNLAPTLTHEEWGAILAVLGTLPAYAIGGLQKVDLPQIRSWGLRGVAVSSGLFQPGSVAQNYADYRTHWEQAEVSAATSTSI